MQRCDIAADAMLLGPQGRTVHSWIMVCSVCVALLCGQRTARTVRPTRVKHAKIKDDAGHWRDRTADLGVISTTL